jgi:2-oxoisovalerate dehydrogenase E1 component
MAFPKAPAILEARDLRGRGPGREPERALLRIYAWMQLARVTDNRILDLFRQGLIRAR